MEQSAAVLPEWHQLWLNTSDSLVAVAFIHEEVGPDLAVSRHQSHLLLTSHAVHALVCRGRDQWICKRLRLPAG